MESQPLCCTLETAVISTLVHLIMLLSICFPLVGKQFERIPLSPKLPGDPISIVATGPGKAEMVRGIATRHTFFSFTCISSHLISELLCSFVYLDHLAGRCLCHCQWWLELEGAGEGDYRRNSEQSFVVGYFRSVLLHWKDCESGFLSCSIFHFLYTIDHFRYVSSDSRRQWKLHRNRISREFVPDLDPRTGLLGSAQ